MAQNEDLGVLRRRGSGEQYEPTEQPAEDQIQQTRQHGAPSSRNLTCHVAAGQRHIGSKEPLQAGRSSSWT
jgi:hypothetical protein